MFANDHGRVGGSGSLSRSLLIYVAALVNSLVDQREVVLLESSCSLWASQDAYGLLQLIGHVYKLHAELNSQPWLTVQGC